MRCSWAYSLIRAAIAPRFAVRAALARRPSHACDLPQSLQSEIARKDPGATVVSLRDVSEDDVKFFRADQGGAYPGFARGNFFGDGKPALAVVLLTQAKK